MPEIHFALVLPALAVVRILLWAICMFRINRRIVQAMVFWLAYACLLWYIFSCGTNTLVLFVAALLLITTGTVLVARHNVLGRRVRWIYFLLPALLIIIMVVIHFVLPSAADIFALQ